MLQKVLQLYASRVLSKRSYAKKGMTLSEFRCNVMRTIWFCGDRNTKS